MSRYLYKKIQNISPESLNFQHSGLKLTTLGQDPCGSPGRGWGKGREPVEEPGTVAEAEPGRISKECSTDSGNRGSVTALS